MSDNNQIFTLLVDVRNEQMAQAKVLAKCAADTEALAGPQGRVTKLEAAQTRQIWYTVAIAPALAALHAALRKMGVII